MRPIRISRLTLLNGTARSAVPSRIAVIAAATAATVAALTAAVALAGCSGPAPSHPAAANIAANIGASIAAKAPPAYYLALGDSLAQGVQPDAAGISVETAD